MKPRISIPRTRLLLLLVALISAACGFRGPLYLPEEPPVESGSQNSVGPEDTDPPDEDSDGDEDQLHP